MKTLGGIITAIGFFIAAAAISTSDYETQYPVANPHPFGQIILWALVGLAVMAFGVRVIKAYC